MNRRIALTAAIVFLAACSPSSSDTLVGSWDDLDENVTVQFFDGGMMTIDNDGQKVMGRYVILDEESLRFDLSSAADAEVVPVVLSYKLSGDRLVLTMPDGDSTTMVRNGT